MLSVLYTWFKFLFGKLRIKDLNDEPHLPNKKQLISSQIKMYMLFKTKDVRKRRKFDRKIHKAVRITVDINEKNKRFTVTVQPKMHVNWDL